MYLKFHTILIVFHFSITCCFSQQAQTSVVNELAKTIFTIPEGKITIYTPNFVANEKISGSIIIEPNGNSEKSIAKNKTKLQNHKVDFGAVSTTLQASHYSISKSQPFPMELKLFDEKNNLISSSKIQFPSSVKEKHTSQFIPSYIVAGDPAKMIVANNGSLAHSYVSINNKETKILAASETNVFFETPSDLSGKASFNYKNDTTNLDNQVNVLQINLSAERLNLSRGESTKLNIEVSGLDGLDEEVPLTITNNSPSKISLENGNNQEISIQPDGDTYQITQTIRATQGGSFSISVTIEPPSEDNSSERNDEPLCNCIIDDYSYLINPEACLELGGHCYDDADEKTDIQPTIQWDSYPDFYRKYAVFFSYDSDIEDLKDDIFDKWKAYDELRLKKDSLNNLHNDLLAIDKVLDSVPKTYKDALKRIVDSLQNLQKQLPDNTGNSSLQNVVHEAQAAVDACKKRKADLIKEQQELEEQLEEEKEELIKTLEELKNILRDYNIELDYKFNEDGSLSCTKDTSGMYEYDKEKINDEGDLISGLEKALRIKTKQYKKTLKRLKEIPQQLEAAEKDCEDLEDALEKAKQAKATSDLAAATELRADAICDEMQRLLARLKYWCINNPELYDFLEDIEAKMEKCPKTPEELDDFWNDFDALLKKKKALEDSFAKAANDTQKEMDDIEDDVADLENDIAGIEEQKRKDAQAEQERKQKIAQAEAEEAARAKAAADERKKQSDKQKKEDDKIKDLIKKAKSDEAGDDAFEDLITGMGLDRLDDVTGNLKLGKLIGGLLVIKDQPDCVCPLLKALLGAIKAKKDGGYIGLHVEAYIQAWNECANLSNIVASVSLGGTELTEAINGMTKAQVEKALAALNQAVRIQCD
jgi:uncharacterized coiled-coil DUF342 family protein